MGTYFLGMKKVYIGGLTALTRRTTQNGLTRKRSKPLRYNVISIFSIKNKNNRYIVVCQRLTTVFAAVSKTTTFVNVCQRYSCDGCI